MTKSLIEKELEKLQEKGTWYRYYTKNKDLLIILQKAREELKKKRFCRICKSNEEHEIKLAHMPHEEVVKWSDIEKVLG